MVTELSLPLVTVDDIMYHEGRYYVCGHEDGDACIFTLTPSGVTTYLRMLGRHMRSGSLFNWNLFKHDGKLYAAYFGRKTPYFWRIGQPADGRRHLEDCTLCQCPTPGKYTKRWRGDTSFYPGLQQGFFAYSSKYVVFLPNFFDCSETEDAVAAFISLEALRQFSNCPQDSVFIFNKESRVFKVMRVGKTGDRIIVADDNMTFAVLTEWPNPEPARVYIFDLED